MGCYSVWDVGGCGCGTPTYLCGTCNVPAANLTCSWTSVEFGDGSTTLVYNGTSHTWISACVKLTSTVDGSSWYVRLSLQCSAGYYFLIQSWGTTGTTCPAGLAVAQCSEVNPCAGNFGIRRTGLTCGSSFLATYDFTDRTCCGTYPMRYFDTMTISA